MFTRENENRILQTVPFKTIAKPKRQLEEVRILVADQVPRKRISLAHLDNLNYYSYDIWEKNICWENSENFEDRKPTSLDIPKSTRNVTSINKYMTSGQWVNGIVWNSYEITLSELENECNSCQEKMSQRVIPDYLENDSDEENEYIYDNRNSQSETNSSTLPLPSSITQDYEIKLVMPKSAAEMEEGNQDGENKVSQFNENRPETAEETKAREAREKKSRLNDVFNSGILEDAKLNFTKYGSNNTTTSSFGNNTVSATAQLQQLNKKRITSTIVDHSPIAMQHKNIRINMRPLELKYYHRPRLTQAAITSVWNVTPERKGKHKISQKQGNIRGGHLSSYISNPSDLALTDGDFVCIEYIEERPLVLLNIGMASKIINYYRVPENVDDDTENSAENEPSKVSNNNKSSSLATSSTKRLPRFMANIGKDRINRNTANNNASFAGIDIPKLAEGHTEVLEKGDEFPLLGNIDAGAPPQPCLVNSLFRSPIFSHTSSPTDFLMVRVTSLKKGYSFIIRQIPSLFLSGQQEPLMVIPKPNRNKRMNQFQQNLVQLFVFRYFSNHGDMLVEAADVDREFSYFMNKDKKGVRDIIKKVADLYNENNYWKRKPLNEITLTLESCETAFTAEDVCLQESR